MLKHTPLIGTFCFLRLRTTSTPSIGSVTITVRFGSDTKEADSLHLMRNISQATKIYKMGAKSSKSKGPIQQDLYREEVHEAARRATAEIAGEDLSSRVELSVAINNFRRRSNLRCAIFTRTGANPWVFAGQTEIAMSTVSHTFVRAVPVDYFFEQQQKLRFEVYVTPTDEEDYPLLAKDLVSSVECRLAEIVAARDKTVNRSLSNDQGLLSVTGEEMKRLKHEVSFDMRITGLPGKGLLQAKRECYVVISRTNEPNRSNSNPNHRETIPIYQSATLNPTQPDIQRVTLSVHALCRGDPDRPIRLEVYCSKTGMIGVAETTLSDMEESTRIFAPIQLKTVQSGTAVTPTITISSISINRRYSFLDYVESGLEISLMLAVDFTKSNGDPKDKKSLHFYDTTEPNEYVSAMRSVGEILECYDSDKKYPVYGFGARLPPTFTQTSHCFALNGDYLDPEVEGVEGMVSAYRSALNACKLHGPTHLKEVVDICCKWASEGGAQQGAQTGEEAKTPLRYYILLILTDGVINDMQETLNAIVRASRLPISIVIVGVGSEDFSLMKALDADEEPLYSTEEGTYMERDIVQFVPFREFKDRPYEELAIATLDEIPREVVGYWTKRGTAPPLKVAARTDSHTLKTSDNDDDYDSQQIRPKIHETKAPQFLRALKHSLTSSLINRGLGSNEVEAILSDGVPSAELPYVEELVRRGVTGVPLFSISAPSTPAIRKLEGATAGSVASRPWSGESSSESWHAHQSPAQVIAGSITRSSIRETPSNPGTPVHADAHPITQQHVQQPAECKVCFERPVDVVILPCGHLVICSSCAVTVGDFCPMCRGRIAAVVKTYGT